MKPPRAGYGKSYSVRWQNVGTDETMYTEATTKQAAERLKRSDNWHPRARPTVVLLKDRKP